jgi:prophage antirepressor-like protein
MRTFKFENYDIRVIEKDGEFWFVVEDVAKILKFYDHRKALIDHVQSGDKTIVQDDRHRGILVVNLAGVFALIYATLFSIATDFKEWILREILPKLWSSEEEKFELSDELKVLIKHEKMMADNFNSTNKKIKEIFLFEPIDWKNDIKIALEKVAKNTAKSEQLLKLAYERLECRADANLEMRLKNKKTKMSHLKNEIVNPDYLDIIEEDKRLREIFVSIIREIIAENL